MPYFPPARVPGYHGLLAYAHTHDLVEFGAQLNPNGTHSSLWSCTLCPDIIIGDKVGPIPPGYCRCGWVQKKPNLKKCEECKAPLP